MKDAETLPVGLADIEDAACRLAGLARRTPLLTSEALDDRTGGRILIKPEPLQRTGSFKFRGAYNRLSRLDAAERKAGVVAFSSGNHAQGVAAAAKLLGVPAAIVMPSDAPRTKMENTRALGAGIVEYDRYTESREDISQALVAERSAVLVPSYDDPYIIAGQGTVGLEIAEDVAARGLTLDALLCCVGGGGLIAGSATALRARLSGPFDIFGVEPAGFDDTARSLRLGERVANDPAARSICDALLAPTPGRITFALNRRLLDGGLAVTDAEVEEAMRFAFTHLKLVVEPGGAVALAALLAGKYDARNKTAAIVLSGGNVDPAVFAEIVG